MMKDERRQRLLDQYEDAALQLLMDEYAEAEGERLLKEFEEAERRGEVEDIPEELDQKCRQIIHSSFAAKRRKDRATRIGKMLGKVAVVVLLLTGFSTTLVLSVEAFRIPILNYLIKHDIRFSTLLFLDDSKDPKEDPLESIDVEDCVPKDFQLEHKKSNPNGGFSYVFLNEECDCITIEITPSTGMINYDAENTQQKPTKVNGHEAVLVYGDGYRIIWMNADGNYVVDVTAEGLLEDEFWKIVYRLAK